MQMCVASPTALMRCILSAEETLGNLFLLKGFSRQNLEKYIFSFHVDSCGSVNSVAINIKRTQGHGQVLRGGGREESSEHPDAVRFLYADVRIFRAEFLCADFRADFCFFTCGFQCGS